MEEILKLLENLADNRIFKVVLFAGGAFTTLYQFFTEGPGFLMKRVRIPVWSLMLGAIISYWLFSHSKNSGANPLKFEDFKLYKGEAFGEQTIDIAGKRFLRCDFNHTTLRITGLNVAEIVESNLTNGTRFTFAGPAQVTLSSISELYRSPEMRPMIDTLLDDIKRGTVPIVPPTNSIVND